MAVSPSPVEPVTPERAARRARRGRRSLVIVVAVLVGAIPGYMAGRLTAGGGPATRAKAIAGPGDIPPESPHDDLRVERSGFTLLAANATGTSSLTYAVVITNPNDPAQARPWIASDVLVSITFFDAKGRTVNTADDNLESVLPGASAAVADTADGGPVARMSVHVVARNWTQNDSPVVGKVEATGVRTVVDHADVLTTASLASSFPTDYKSPYVVVVYEDNRGEIIGGSFEYADLLPGMSAITVRVRGPARLPAVAKTEIFASFSLKSLVAGGRTHRT